MLFMQLVKDLMHDRIVPDMHIFFDIILIFPLEKCIIICQNDNQYTAAIKCIAFKFAERLQGEKYKKVTWTLCFIFQSLEGELWVVAAGVQLRISALLSHTAATL
jgi:hypothetical protein